MEFRKPRVRRLIIKRTDNKRTFTNVKSMTSDSLYSDHRLVVGS